MSLSLCLLIRSSLSKCVCACVCVHVCVSRSVVPLPVNKHVIAAGDDVACQWTHTHTHTHTHTQLQRESVFQHLPNCFSFFFFQGQGSFYKSVSVCVFCVSLVVSIAQSEGPRVYLCASIILGMLLPGIAGWRGGMGMRKGALDDRQMSGWRLWESGCSVCSAV